MMHALRKQLLPALTAACLAAGAAAWPATAAKALLAAHPDPGLPVITGAGDEDQTPISEWKTYNGIPQVTRNPQYPWGEPLRDNNTTTRYSFVIDTGQLSPPHGDALLSFYSVHQMFHLDPNPYADVLSWKFLSKFRRLPDGTLAEQHGA